MSSHSVRITSNPFMRTQFLLLGSLLLVLSLEARSADMELVLSPEVRAKILEQLPPGKAARTIERYATTHEINHKANFSKVYADENSAISMQDDGLTGVTAATAFRSSSKGRGRALSLCGLVTLLVESGSNVDTSTAVPLPIGKLFVPFGVKSDIDVSNRAKLVAFEASVPSICSPSPGGEFSYKTEVESQVKTSGMFGRTNDFRRTESVGCKAAAISQPAVQVNASLSGDYLPVSCVITPQAGAPRTAEYAFFPDARFYLPVELKDEWQLTKIRYTEFVYASP
jgi:hypothetical protein